MNKFLILLIVVGLLSCNKDERDPYIITAAEQLPPATQVGAKNFGCLLDGQIFKPGLSINSLNCFYQFVEGEYFFSVSADNSRNSILTALSIGTEKKQIFQGQTYELVERNYGNAHGRYFLGNNNTGVFENNYTSIENSGELKITKLDFSNNIVSGTFWFDIKDSQGVIHQIRDGRFDMQFTQ